MENTATTESKDVMSAATTSSTNQQKSAMTKNASWGAILSIVIILAMVIIGAFYAWGQRINEERSIQNQTSNP